RIGSIFREFFKPLPDRQEFVADDVRFVKNPDGVMTFDKTPNYGGTGDDHARDPRKPPGLTDPAAPNDADGRTGRECSNVIADKDLIMYRLQRHSGYDLLIEKNERNNRKRECENALSFTQIDGFECGRNDQKYHDRDADIFGKSINIRSVSFHQK